MSEKTIRCPNCSRKFVDNNAVRSHLKAKHGGKGLKQFPKPEAEESMADIFLEAELNRAMGVRNEDWIEDMRP